MIIDAEQIDNAVIGQIERDIFMRRGELPQRFRVWLGYHNAMEWYTKLHHLFIRSQRSDESVLPPRHNINTIAIGIGHIFVLWFIDRTQGKFDMNVRGRNQALRQLWPLRDMPLVWPLPLLADAEVERLSNIIKEYPGWRF